MLVFNLNQEIRTSASYTDANNDPADPSGVLFTIKAPGVASVIYQYGVDPEVIKDGTGEYHFDQVLSSSGFWVGRWYSTGDIITGSADIWIRVRETLTDG